MENNNTERELTFRLLFCSNVKGEKRFFVSSNLETPKEYLEVWIDTQEYKEKKFREYLRNNSPFDEGLYCLLRNFNEYDWFFSEKEKKELHKGASDANAIDIDDDEIPF